MHIINWVMCVKKILKNYLWYIVGSFIYSVAVTVFISANEISPGGITGVATVLNYILKVPTGITLFALNIPILILGFAKFGGHFIIDTTLVTGIISVVMTVTEKLIPPFEVDKILAAVFGGGLLGLGISIIMLHGSTTGGVDIIAKLINRKFRHITVGKIIMFFDAFVVLLAVAVYGNLESALYSVVSMFACSSVLDRLLYGSDRGKVLYIITDRWEEISKAVVGELSRGVTLIDVKGGFTGNSKKMLMFSVRPYEVAGIYGIIEKIDYSAFIIVTEAGEIIGEGFKRFD